MPGTPSTSPVFGAPRYDDADDATFAEQVNPITDVFDRLAVRTDDPRMADPRNPLPNSVTLASIADGTITGGKLAAGTITQTNLAASSVGSAQIIDGTIVNADLASNAVDSRIIAPGGVTTAVIADGAVTQTKLAGPLVQSQVVTGDLITSVATARAGCVICNGAAYSRTDPTYAGLYAVIGTKYGSGDGVTTYNVPNLVGCAIVAADPTGARLPVNHPAVGAVFGSESTSIQVGELPSHGHPASIGAAATGIGIYAAQAALYDPGHAHTQWGADTSFKYGGGNNSTVTFIGSWAGNDHGTAGAATGIYDQGHAHNVSDPTHAHAVSVGNTGNGQAHPNCPPSFAANIFIKL